VSFANERVPLRALLTDIETLVAPQVRAKQLTFSLGDWDESLAAQGDSDKVRQIIVNLLSNAVKFTPRAGKISVNCVVEGTTVHVYVRDSGVGIPKEKLQAVFEPFVQLDRSLTNIGEGSGLGLSISRELARGMRGDLIVESKVGVGSTFILSLPVATPSGA
jgi:signal transduction histidine kinase